MKDTDAKNQALQEHCTTVPSLAGGGCWSFPAVKLHDTNGYTTYLPCAFAHSFVEAKPLSSRCNVAFFFFLGLAVAVAVEEGVCVMVMLAGAGVGTGVGIGVGGGFGGGVVLGFERVRFLMGEGAIPVAPTALKSLNL